MCAGSKLTATNAPEGHALQVWSSQTLLHAIISSLLLRWTPFNICFNATLAPIKRGFAESNCTFFGREAQKLKVRWIIARPLTYSILFVREVHVFFSPSLYSQAVWGAICRRKELMRHKNTKTTPPKKTLSHRRCAFGRWKPVSPRQRLKSLFVWMETECWPQRQEWRRALSELLPSPDAFFSLQRCSPSFAFGASRIKPKKNNNPKTNSHCILSACIKHVFTYISAKTDFCVSTATRDCGYTLICSIKVLARWGLLFLLYIV